VLLLHEIGDGGELVLGLNLALHCQELILGLERLHERAHRGFPF
jgi:hypothetical protein